MIKIPIDNVTKMANKKMEPLKQLIADIFVVEEKMISRFRKGDK